MISRLGKMFERTAQVRDAADLHEVLEDVCRTISELLGYRAVVINVYRPAFDDMHTSAAVGSEESVRELVGKSSPRETWVPLLDERFARRGAYFVPADEFDWDALGVHSYVPRHRAQRRTRRLEGGATPCSCRCATRSGLLIGVISVDEPESGRRPNDDEIDALVAIASHAALALRMAQDTAHDVEHQRMLEGMLEVSARVAEARGPEAILQAVSDGIQDALGFETVVIELAARPDLPLVPRASSGWYGEARASSAMTLEALDPLLTDEFEIAGCYLVPTEVADERLGVEPASMYRSELYGRGPNAWSRHWLIVPLDEPQGRRRGADLGGRAARPAAPHPRAAPGAAAVREPGGGRAPVRGPGAEAAPRGDPRPAHRAPQPARLPRAAGARDGPAGRGVRAGPVRHGQPEARERHARPRGRATSR